MIARIINEIRIFVFILVCVLAGFAQAFWLLNNNDSDLIFGTVSQSFLNTFLYMLGQNVSADFEGAASPYVATVFLIVFLLIMMILMLNILIALMGDVFSKVRSEELGLWRKEQAAIILEESFLAKEPVERTGSSSIFSKMHPHLFVLKYTAEVKDLDVDFRKDVEGLVWLCRVPTFTILNMKDYLEESIQAKELLAKKKELEAKELAATITKAFEEARLAKMGSEGSTKSSGLPSTNSK